MSNIGTKFILAERFTFDPLSNSLIDKENSEEIIRLGSNESRILWLLAQHPNEVVSRNDLHDFVWREQGFEVDDSSLTQAISTLRKLLKDSTKSPQYVKTVPKRGYQLITRVDTVEEEIQRSIEVDESAQQNNNIDVAETLNLMPAISSPHAQSATQTAINKPTHDWGARLIFLVAMIIPLAVLLLTNPSQSKFKAFDCRG